MTLKLALFSTLLFLFLFSGVRAQNNGVRRQTSQTGYYDYKDLLEELQKSHGAKFSMKNNLGIVFNLRDNYKFEFVEPDPENRAYGAGAINVKTLDAVYAGKSSYKYYRNNSDHVVIIPGIEKKEFNGKYVFIDASIELQPKEKIDFFPIEKTFVNKDNSKGKYIQYFGDVGELSNLMAARIISPGTLEVDSYVNTTTIKVKKGDRVSLRASGKITLGAFAGDGGPEGISGRTAYNQVENFRHGALLGRIGKANGFWLARQSHLLLLPAEFCSWLLTMETRKITRELLLSNTRLIKI